MALTTPDTSAIVILNGVPVGGWVGVEVTQSFDKASGDGTVRFSPQPGVPLPVHLGDEVVIVFAGTPAMTGHVHRVWGDHEDKTHSIQAKIRDKTQDAVDSTVGPKLDIDPPVTLQQVAQKTLGAMGLGSIGVIDKVGAEPFEKGEKVSAAIDHYGHQFIEQWARKRHCVLTTDGLGNLVIDQNQGEMLAGAFIHFGLPDDPLNNCTKSQFAVEDFDRHNSHAVAGQKSPNHKSHWESRAKDDPDAQPDKMSNRYGVAYDSSVRPERRKHSRGGQGMQGRTAWESAKWRANTMRAKSNEYIATVAGFTTPGGALWWPGKLVPVYDYWWDISANLFLKEVIFTKDWGKGSITQLKFAIGDAFKDQSGRDADASRTGSDGLPGDPGEVYDKPGPSELGLDNATEVDADQ